MRKSCKLPFQVSDKREIEPLTKIHSDLWGPAPIASSQGINYYVIFVDDCTRFTWIYPMKKKSKFLTNFVTFHKLVENQFSRKIKIFQCDGGEEFNSLEFINYLAQNGIKRQISCPHTSEQNGALERKHRHIVETGLTLLFNANLSMFMWV